MAERPNAADSKSVGGP